jgi:hypothetical protein
MHEERTIREQFEECYIKLFQDPQCMKAVCGLLHQPVVEKQQVILNVLLRFLGIASREEIVSLIPLVMRSTSKLLQSAVTAIRRLIVLILVEFKSKAATEFNPYFRQLSAQQQRLIETYLTKRGD